MKQTVLFSIARFGRYNQRFCPLSFASATALMNSISVRIFQFQCQHRGKPCVGQNHAGGGSWISYADTARRELCSQNWASPFASPTAPVFEYFTLENASDYQHHSERGLTIQQVSRSITTHQFPNGAQRAYAAGAMAVNPARVCMLTSRHISCRRKCAHLRCLSARAVLSDCFDPTER